MLPDFAKRDISANIAICKSIAAHIKEGERFAASFGPLAADLTDMEVAQFYWLVSLFDPPVECRSPCRGDRRPRHRLCWPTFRRQSGLFFLPPTERLDREGRSIQRRLRLARFPNHKTLDNFKIEAQPSLPALVKFGRYGHGDEVAAVLFDALAGRRSALRRLGRTRSQPNRRPATGRAAHQRVVWLTRSNNSIS